MTNNTFNNYGGNQANQIGDDATINQNNINVTDENAQSLINFLNKIQNEANPAELKHIVGIVKDLQNGIAQTDKSTKATFFKQAIKKTKAFNLVLKTSENLTGYAGPIGVMIASLFGAG